MLARGATVLDHPDRATIEKMFLTGWTASKIHNWLVSREKVPVSVQTLAHFRDNHIDAKLILPPSVYEQKLKHLDVQIDALQELYNLVEIQKRRLSYILKVEDDSRITLPDARDEMRLLKDTIVKVIQLEMELGIRDKRPMEIIEKRIDITELLKEFIAQKELMTVIEP